SLGLRTGEEGLSLPFSVERMTVHEAGARGGVVYVRRTEGAVNVTLADAQGRILVEVHGLRSRPTTREMLGRAEQGVGGDLYAVGGPAKALAHGGALPAGRWVVVGGDGLADALAKRIEGTGRSCTQVEASCLKEAMPAEYVVCVWAVDEGSDVAAEAVHVAT